MSVVVSIVNYLRTRKLKHRLFKLFLEEVDAEYGDVVYHTDVRWLGRANVLKRFISLKTEITTFLKTEYKVFSELNDSSWNEDLFFLGDITSHLNDLNIQLQGKRKLIFDFLAAVISFKAKLRLFKSQFLKGMLIHFPICSQHISPERQLAAGIKYAEHIELLNEEFNNRLSLSSGEELHLKIIENPFSIDPAEAPPRLQMELIDLQASSAYKSKHAESRLQDFYKCLNKESFKNLLTLAKQIFSLFGSAYICEQTFSVMNFNKNKQRSSITDGHLEDILKISCSSIVPDYAELVANKRCNISH
uniref:general transcription factor II-I repeat domain-containing protein 2-like n=1 Tax=Styela clava TaxID=7725 RepID=UPI00193ACE58|nr:general transcription factor II-I repeat domain-containing protein 2-like [Styela clava]